jgi:phosphohistidine phosphatase SixA
MTVFLVRHAHAVGRGGWDGDDMARPLSPRGRRQVSGLTTMLAGSPVRRVISSPAVRCMDTVEPLAGRLGLTVKARDELLEGSPQADAFELLRQAAGRRGDAVVCCHGDLVPEVLRWMARQGAELLGGDKWAKGSTWVLEWDGADERFLRGRYSPPPEG